MKAKLILLLFILLCTNYVFGQNKVYDFTDCLKIEVGNYLSINDVEKVYAITSKDTCNIYLIEVEPSNEGVYAFGGDTEKGRYFLHYNDTLYTTLKKIEEKYKEWTEVAKNNVTPKFEKEIPIDIPVAGTSVYNIKHPKFELLPVNKKRYTFMRINQEKNFLKVTMKSNFNYYHKWGHKIVTGKTEIISFFPDTEQFSAFVELFNPDKFRDRLGKSTIDNLFK